MRYNVLMIDRTLIHNGAMLHPEFTKVTTKRTRAKYAADVHKPRGPVRKIEVKTPKG